MSCKNRQLPHFVYVLIKNGFPIYTGCTLNPKRRELCHKMNKDFDYLMVLKEYPNKHLALSAEQGIILFISLLNDERFLNGKYHTVVLAKQFLDSHYINKQNG